MAAAAAQVSIAQIILFLYLCVSIVLYSCIVIQRIHLLPLLPSCVFFGKGNEFCLFYQPHLVVRKAGIPTPENRRSHSPAPFYSIGRHEKRTNETILCFRQRVPSDLTCLRRCLRSALQIVDAVQNLYPSLDGDDRHHGGPATRDRADPISTLPAP